MTHRNSYDLSSPLLYLLLFLLLMIHAVVKAGGSRAEKESPPKVVGVARAAYI